MKDHYKQAFIEALMGLLSDTVQDAHRPDRIPKSRNKRENKSVRTLAAMCDVELSSEEVDTIIGV